MQVLSGSESDPSQPQPPRTGVRAFRYEDYLGKGSGSGDSTRAAPAAAAAAGAKTIHEDDGFKSWNPDDDQVRGQHPIEFKSWNPASC